MPVRLTIRNTQLENTLIVDCFSPKLLTAIMVVIVKGVKTKHIFWQWPKNTYFNVLHGGNNLDMQVTSGCAGLLSNSDRAT